MAILCPYCLTAQNFTGANRNKCQNPDCPVQEVPTPYIENARRIPPIWLTTFGTPKHGKTVFTNALTLYLESLGKIAENAYREELDSYTLDKIKNIRKPMRDGIAQHESTQFDQRPLLISVSEFIPDKTHTLVLYDLPGEISDEVMKLRDYAAAIAQAKAVWFIVSLYDLRRDQEGRSISDLFATYQQGMRALGAKIEGRELLVIYTKADLLLQDQEIANQLPTAVLKYLRDDPYANIKTTRSRDLPAFDLNAYLDEMEAISDELQEFTQDYVEGGAEFIARARKSKLKLSFCMTTAQGMAANISGQMGVAEPPRRRVLDPLIWAITRRWGDEEVKTFALILDTSSRLSGLDLPRLFFDALVDKGMQVTTFVAGTSRRVFDVGQSPADLALSDSHLNLIGPILDTLPADAYATLLLQKEPPDLADFIDTSWEKRLLVITLDRQVANFWNNRAVWGSQGDPYEIIGNFLDK